MAFNIWERWPWTSFQNLNLDWLMKAVKEAVTKAEQASESVGQFDDRITANENAIEQLGINLETISSPAHVMVNSELEARYRGNLVTGAQLVAMMRTHGDLPYVEYNGEIYMLDTANTAGDLRFSMVHTTQLDDVYLRHIMIPAQSSNAAYSITNIDGGSGSSGNVFAVVVRAQSGGYVADHTYAEILSQMQNGRIPVLLVVQGNNYESCPMARVGSSTIGGESVNYVEFADTDWMVSNTSDVIGSWRICSNGTVSRMAPFKHLATVDDIIDFVNDGVATNALLKTAQTLSAAEQAQARDNIGAVTAMTNIPVTLSNGVYSTTMTTAEILNHLVTNGCCIAWNGLYFYPAGGTYSGPFGALYFECVWPASSQKASVSVFQLNMNGGDTAPTIERYARDININGSQPYIQVANVTTYNLPSNTLVEFTGDSTSLSISLATAIETDITHEYHFIFHSGSTPTTLTLPNTVRQPDGFTVEANHVYEVSILNNNMTAQGWAVTP